MRALRIERFGPVEELRVSETPTPEAGAGEARVRVRAASVSPLDVKNTAGGVPATTLPRIPGRDFAGEVDGQAVWGTGGGGLGITRDGSHAEFVVQPAAAVRPKPRNLSFEQAAAVGVSFTTAWLALVRAAGLQAGETALIIGAAGSVGTAAAQIACWRGARVIGADRGNSAELDTTQPQWEDLVRQRTGGRGVDAVFDMVGGEAFEPGLRSLRHRGRAVVISSPHQRRVSFDLLDFYHAELTLIGVDSLALSPAEGGDLLDQLRTGFESGALTPPRLLTFPLDQVAAAYQAAVAGTGGAKVVLTP